MISHCLAFGQVKSRKIFINNKIRESIKNDSLYLIPSENDLMIEFDVEQNDSSKFYYSIYEKSETPIWIKSKFPTAHFQSLKGGEYVFQLKQKNLSSDKILSEIKINKKRDVWQDFWFWPLIVFYVLMVICIVIYLYFLYTLSQKLKMQKVRNQIATDLHDEVGSNLSSIAIYVELLRRKVSNNNLEVQAILSKISENSEETVSLMKDTVWAINPVNDSTEKLLTRMQSFGIEILSAKGIPLTFECDADLNKVKLSIDQRRNLYLIFKESINNIAKHSEATKVFCNIKRTEDSLEVLIKDNGKGFIVENTFEGNGLKNFKSRSNDEELAVFIESILGFGTTIKTVLSLN